MKIQILLATLCLIACTSQNDEPQKFNFDFEELDINYNFPTGWFKTGDIYHFELETENVYSGKNAVSIHSDEGNYETEGLLTIRIPNEYSGREIKLEGFIKTKDVALGHAGLFIRLEKEQRVVNHDNMMFQNLRGTNDWEKHTVSLPFVEDIDVIYVGAILNGKGKAWFDNFSVYIDGKNISTGKPSATKADLDHAFVNGSEFEIDPNFSELHIENLYQLGNSWGYLKYHHPDVAKGDYNWDNELFRFLPNLNEDNFEKELDKWIASYGKFEPQALGKHHYVDFVRTVDNPIFKNEKLYPSMNWDDDGFRILALFRYWNMIEYFFPYKYMIEKDWDEVLREYIPKIIQANDELSYKLTLLELIGEVHDSHANIWQWDIALNSFFGNNTAPLEVTFIEDKPIVTKIFEPFDKDSKIKIGDEIVLIDKTDVLKIVEEKIRYTPGSNNVARLRDVSRRILRTNDDYIEITFSNSSGRFTEKVKTLPLHQVNFWSNNNPSHETIENDIGYIYPTSLKQGEIHEIMEIFMDKKGIIVDLRSYPSDFIVYTMGEHIHPQPIEYVKISSVDKENLGSFLFAPPKEVGKENNDYFKGKIAILVNEQTQSQPEYTTMALRIAPKAKVIGSQTAGADGNMSEIYLPGNIRTFISGVGIYYPDGTKTQRIGIVPDIEVKPTINGIRQGKDEVLEAALEYIERH